MGAVTLSRWCREAFLVIVATLSRLLYLYQILVLACRSWGETIISAASRAATPSPTTSFLHPKYLILEHPYVCAYVRHLFCTQLLDCYFLYSRVALEAIAWNARIWHRQKRCWRSSR